MTSQSLRQIGCMPLHGPNLVRRSPAQEAVPRRRSQPPPYRSRGGGPLPCVHRSSGSPQRAILKIGRSRHNCSKAPCRPHRSPPMRRGVVSQRCVSHRSLHRNRSMRLRTTDSPRCGSRRPCAPFSLQTRATATVWYASPLRSLRRGGSRRRAQRSMQRRCAMKHLPRIHCGSFGRVASMMRDDRWNPASRSRVRVPRARLKRSQRSDDLLVRLGRSCRRARGRWLS